MYYNGGMRQLILLLALIPTSLEMAQQLTCARPPKIVKIVNIDPVQEKCLAVTIFGEARGESEKGQIAVAYTILNRSLNKRKTLCDIALAPKQYSIFNNNPKLRAIATSLHLVPQQKNIIDKNSWDRAMAVAQMVARKTVQDPGHGATHYVAYKSLTHIPDWTRKFKVSAKIDNHTFFVGSKVQVAKI